MKRLLLVVGCLVLLLCSGAAWFVWSNRGTEFTSAYLTVEVGVSRYRKAKGEWPRRVEAVLPYLDENEARLVKQTLDFGIQVEFIDSGGDLVVHYRGKSGLGGRFDVQRSVRVEEP
jgi:hypothetical protein